MQVPLLCVWMVLGMAALTAQPGLAPEVVLLSQVKAHMRENLTRLPDYTCTQALERSVLQPPSKRFVILERLRLEVALVDGKEMFAWPGANQFETSDLRTFVTEGGVGTGDFALHARSIFLSTTPDITFSGQTTLEGRKLFRYEYRVPQVSSGYFLRAVSRETQVGYSGSFWVDPATLDVARLDLKAEDIPPDLGLAETTTSIGYGRIRIGDAAFLLPVSSEQSMTLFTGLRVRNRAEFRGCRQFKGESAISFGEVALSPEAARAPVATEVTLPGGLQLDLILETPIDWMQSYVGDALTAHVARDVKKDGAVIVPKGALVSGRIAQLRKLDAPFPRFALRLVFTSLQFEGKRAGCPGRLMGLGPLAGYSILDTGNLRRAPQGRAFILNSFPRSGPGDGVFSVSGSQLHVPAGLPIQWRTEDAPAR